MKKKTLLEEIRAVEKEGRGGLFGEVISEHQSEHNDLREARAEEQRTNFTQLGNSQKASSHGWGYMSDRVVVGEFRGRSARIKQTPGKPGPYRASCNRPLLTLISGFQLWAIVPVMLEADDFAKMGNYYKDPTIWYTRKSMSVK